jgi:delta-aminolevulinic acid dehydratase/porphobilinogen synthase
MINRIYTALAAAGIILLALFGIHRSGKKSGKAESKANTNEQILQNQETAKTVKDTVAAMPDASVRDKLRNSWKRK